MGYFQAILDYLRFDSPFYPRVLKRFAATQSFNKINAELEEKFGDQIPAHFQELPKIEGNLPSVGKGPVLFAVADLAYFQKFADIFLTSAALRSPENAVHLHIIGATPAEAREATKLLTLKPTNFGLTFERGSVAKMNEYDLGRFCQCMRFIRLESFVAQTNLEYIAFDIDSIIRKSFANLGPIFHTRPIGLIRRFELDPTRKIAAGVVYVRPDQKSKSFLDHANRMMLLHLKHGPFTAMLDQRCLSMAMKKYPLTVFAIPNSIYSFSPGEGHVYSAKGVKKRDLLAAFKNEEKTQE